MILRNLGGNYRVAGLIIYRTIVSSSRFVSFFDLGIESRREGLLVACRLIKVEGGTL